MENISNLEENINVKTALTTHIKQEKIGGMALFNGLLLKNAQRETIINVINGKIAIEMHTIEKNDKMSLTKLPIIRGVINIISTITSSVPYIVSSAKSAVKSMTNEEIEVGDFEIICGYIISIFLLLSLFTAIPNVFSLLVTDSLKNVLQALLQGISFILYLVMVKKSTMLQDVFEYHGAEHKVVNAYENLPLTEITVKNVKKESRFHKRCGGNFVVYLFLLIILMTFIIPSTNLLLKTTLQVVLLPLLIGISYEILMLFSKLPKMLSFLAYPAMLIQFATTKEPNDEKLRIAIYALRGCVSDDNRMSLKMYLDRYVKDNLEKIPYDLMDILRVVAFVKKIDKDTLYATMAESVLSYQEQIIIDTLLHKLYEEHIPLQYILGVQSFYKEEYIVNEDVLIPRADSEILVETAISYIEKYQLETMIDMCTGSGCIGISIAKNSSLRFASLVDISTAALNITRQNIMKNNSSDKVCAIQSDLFEIFANKTMANDKKYDIIVSNPPYIPTADIAKLEKQVQNEPTLALDGGKDGMDIYKRILTQAKVVLKEQGFLLFEIGYDELEIITSLIQKDPSYEICETKKDLGGNDRVIVCRFLQK